MKPTENTLLLDAEESKSDLSPEEREEIIGFLLETLLLDGQKINQGKDGVIARVNMGDIEEDERMLISDNPDMPSENAVKLIKIYSPGKGAKEARAQKAAYEALKGIEGNANVPRVYMYRDLKIRTDEVRERLESKYDIDMSDGVEIILMEYVDGDDLLTMLYKEVIRVHPYVKWQHKKNVDEYTYEDLVSLYKGNVPNLLDMKIPGGKGGNEAEKNFEINAVRKANISKLIDFLKRHDYSISESIVKSIGIAIEALNTSGIYHTDLHERNIMITKEGIPYIVDFGDAFVREFDDGSPEDKAKNRGKVMLHDLEIMDILKRLTRLEIPGISDKIRKRVAQIRADDYVKETLEKIRIAQEEGKIEITSDYIAKYMKQVPNALDKIYWDDNEYFSLIEIARWKSENIVLVVKYIEKRLQDETIDDNFRIKLSELKNALSGQ